MKKADDSGGFSRVAKVLPVAENLCHKYCIDTAWSWYEFECAD